MVARLARSTTGYAAQYVGTTRVSNPSPTPGSPTCRSFNGQGDRIVALPSDQLGANFMVVMSFWRLKAEGVANDHTAMRLFTQYCSYGTRVAVGVNQSSLSVTYTNSNGTRSTLESKDKVLDLARHTLALVVTASQILVLLDGRESIRINVALAAPSPSRVNIGADSNRRFWYGLIDDLAVYLEANLPRSPENWLRYYIGLLNGVTVRDYEPAVFDQGADGATATNGGLSANGLRASSRVPLNTAWRRETALGKQAIEMKFAGGGPFRIGAFNPAHAFASQDLGATDQSFAWVSDGTLVVGGSKIATGLGQWGAGNVMAMVWDPQEKTVTLYRDGTKIDTRQLDDLAWTPAATVGTGSVQLNAGQFLPWSAPAVAPLPSRVYSKLTTEFRETKIGSLAAALDDPDATVRDSRTGAAVGVYNGASTLVDKPRLEAFERMRKVGSGIKITAAEYTAADTDFFFALAFSPAAADLTGEHVLLESPGKWGLRIIDGGLQAWIGDVTVGQQSPAFEAGKVYLMGLSRTASGKLAVWCHLGYILHSTDDLTTQAAGDVWVGSGENGARALVGEVSHLLLAGTMPALTKLDRIRAIYDWDMPKVLDIVPDPVSSRRVFELPYREVLRLGVSAPNASLSYLGAIGEQPEDIALRYRMVERMGAGAFAGTALGNWTPTLQSTAAVKRLATVLRVTGNLASAVVGQAALIDDEVIRIDAVDTAAGTVTVARGCLDTVPAAHAAGAKVWLYESTLTSNKVGYPGSGTAEVKLLSRSASAEIDETQAPTDQIQVKARQGRPYPAAAVTINDQAEPTELAGTVLIKWNGRNRVTQGSSLVAWTEASVDVAEGTTWLVRAFDSTGKQIHQSTTIATADRDYRLYVEYTGDLSVKVIAVENGRESLQAPTLTFAYTNVTDSVLATQEGEAMENEGETHNITPEQRTAIAAGSYDGQMPDDYVYEEEEEEDVMGAEGMESDGHIQGVKFSEFGHLPQFDGNELFPMAKGGSNYFATVQELIAYVVASVPKPADGKDAYHIALEHGFVGSESDWLDSLHGDKGDTGPSSNANRRIQTITAGTGSITCNWELYDEIRIRLVGNVTLTFQGAKDGQGCMLKLQQDSVGGRTATLPNNVRFNKLINEYTVSADPVASDKAGFMYDAADSRYDFVSIVPGI